MKFVARININSIHVSPSFEFKLLRNALIITKVYILLRQPSYTWQIQCNRRIMFLLASTLSKSEPLSVYLQISDSRVRSYDSCTFTGNIGQNTI